MKQNQKKGFTLIEILATIFIVSIIFGIGSYFIITAIKNGEEKSAILSTNLLEDSASTYSQENQNEILWQKEIIETDENTKVESGNQFTCISINNLVNKGYITQKDANKFTSDYILITKDSNNIIIKKELDTKGICSTNITEIQIPTSKEYCLNSTYSNTTQELTIPTTNENFYFENNTGKNAGTYEVIAKLRNEENNPIKYTWNDGTITDKKIICSLKKKVPTLSFEPTDGEDGKTLGTTNVTLTSNTPGTISLKSSNKDIATAKITDSNNQITTSMNIEITKLATRKALTYITATITPTDQKNYYSTSIIYTIGEIKKVTLNLQNINSQNYCTNPYYNGSDQYITTDPEEGIIFYNNYQKEINDYEVTAKLKYGYTWSDTETDTTKFQCSILRPELTITYITNGGSNCNQKKVTYEDEYGDLCTPTKTGYTFDGWWYTDKSKKITSTSKVELWYDHNLEATWSANTYQLTYNTNGGNACSPSTKAITYNNTYGSLCQPTRTGYTFNGWYTSQTGGSQITSSTIVTTTQNQTIYAQWTKNTYSISYTLNGGTLSNQKTSYAVDSDAYTLPTPTKNGYSFSGWTGSNGTTPQQTVTIPTGSTGNRSYTANWSINTYNITYNLDGGTLSNAKTSYTTEESVTLGIPTKTGYFFSGWTGSNGTTTQRSVTIATGSTGNKEYTANWIAISCSISYDGTSGTNGWYTSTGKLSISFNGISTSYLTEYGLVSGTNSQNNKTTSISITSETKGTNYTGYIKIGDYSKTCSFYLKVDTTAPIICKYGYYSGDYQRFCGKDRNSSALTAQAAATGHTYFARWGFGIKDTGSKLYTVTVAQYQDSTKIETSGSAGNVQSKTVADAGIFWIKKLKGSSKEYSPNKYIITISDMAGNTSTYSYSNIKNFPSTGSTWKCSNGITKDTVCH